MKHSKKMASKQTKVIQSTYFSVENKYWNWSSSSQCRLSLCSLESIDFFERKCKVMPKTPKGVSKKMTLKQRNTLTSHVTFFQTQMRGNTTEIEGKSSSFLFFFRLRNIYLAISKHFDEVPHFLIPEIRVIITYIFSDGSDQCNLKMLQKFFLIA